MKSPTPAPAPRRPLHNATPPRLRRRLAWHVAATALAVAAFAGSIRAAAPVAPAAVDAIFAAYSAPGSPGAALVVARDGVVLHARGYGHATLSPAAPIGPDTAFYVGSVSKQFTAAAIALLHVRGRLSLDDDVRRHVPELPDYDAVITLRHCVHHTSGLRDYLALRDLAGGDPNAHFDDAAVLALLRRQRALMFPPGTRFSYSNSGYFLLSLVVRRVTGRSLRDFAAAEIFRPLGMADTQFRDRHDLPVPHRADGFSPAPGGAWRVNNPNFDVVGAGGVFMPARDFLAWDRNFSAPQVGDAAFLELLQTPATLVDGTRSDYAFGLRVGHYRGLPIVEHTGSYGGFRAHTIRFPAQGFSVVCFANVSTAEPAELNRRVADLYLAAAFTAPRPPPPSAPGAAPSSAKKSPAKTKTKAAAQPFDAAAFAGSYHSEELGVDFELVAGATSAALHLRRPGRPLATLLRTAPDVFTAGTLRLEFVRDTNGRPAGFRLPEGRAAGVVFVRR